MRGILHHPDTLLIEWAQPAGAMAIALGLWTIAAAALLEHAVVEDHASHAISRAAGEFCG
jgi:hypothetical protein